MEKKIKWGFTVKKAIQICFLLAISFYFSTLAKASLISTLDGVAVYDNQAGLYWLADLTLFRGYTYSEQITEISNLPGNWNMASIHEFETLDLNSDTEIHNTFTHSVDVSFSNEPPKPDTIVYIYAGRINEPLGESPSGTHKFVDMTYNVTDDFVRSPLRLSPSDWQDEWSGFYGAWVVTNNYSPIPIPSAVWLLGPSLIGLVVFGRKPKN